MDMNKLKPWNWFRREDESRPVSWSSRMSEYRPLLQIQQDIDRLFDETFRRFGLGTSRLDKALGRPELDFPLKPTVDIQATDQAYLLKVELPGVTEEDIKLEVTDRTLVLRGEKKQDKEEEGKDFYHRERVYGAFQRVLDLPEDADPEAVEARFKQGILTISVARRPVEKPAARPVPIQSA